MARPYPDHPQLTGNFAPIRMECDAPDLVIEGEMPRELHGTFYRNGPDPQFAPRGSHHWFAGDGMIHAFHIEDGRVSYLNRWARTIKWKLENQAGEALFSAFNPLESDERVAEVDTDGLANTNIVWHGGKLLALEEGHAPFEMGPRDLSSAGAWTFDGKLEGPMTAHPKIDPDTGEMLFFGYMATGPFTEDIRFHVADKQGRLTRSETFKAPFASMVHDFITTQNHVVFPIFPLTGSLDRAMEGGPAFAWEPEKGTHVGIMPRNGSVNDMRWFEADACYVFHPMNAYEENGKVIAHVMKFEEAPLFPRPDGTMGDPKNAEAKLCRWEFDLEGNTNTFKQEYLDELTGEFPRLDERFTGLKYRHGYYAATTGDSWQGNGFNSIVHHDHETGRRRVYNVGAHDATSEPIFVPRASDAPEGDGYIIAIAYRGDEHRSDLLVLDAKDIEAGPVATAKLTTRVPHGFHGNWRPAT